MNKNSQKLSRKAREWEFRKQAIIEAAQEVFLREGYHKATMAQIARRAEFGMGTIYQFFPNKQILFTQIILNKVEGFMQGLKESLATKFTGKDQLRLFIEYKVNQIELTPEFQKLFMEIFYIRQPDIASKIINRLIVLHAENMQIIQDIFSRINKEDNYNFDPELMALTVLGVLNQIASDWYLGLLSKSPAEYIPGIMDGIFGGKNSE
ncbi:MAG: TetR/AcrR family transcriptional regulator [Deltaproteobacteria bacterium]|nr:TetR/AcrR family transcriptional regulator [Deltaproteobacteria bacterium]